MTHTFTFPCTAEGSLQRTLLAINLQKVGHTTENKEVTVAGTVLLVLEVTGKRAGEGLIALNMKARKHGNR
jgi:hypothetical protein